MEDSENDFNERSAKDIVFYLLKSDNYKEFLSEIDKFDSDSLHNMLQGIKAYKYKIKNREKFDLLLEKFDNFKVLMEEWYDSKEKYHYIKQLWDEYICIESIKDKNENEIEEYLSGYKIDYKNWPKSIKDKFKFISYNTVKTYIYPLCQALEKLSEEKKEIIKILFSISVYYKNTFNGLLYELVMKYIKTLIEEHEELNIFNVEFIKSFLNIYFIQELKMNYDSIPDFFNLLKSKKDNFFISKFWRTYYELRLIYFYLFLFSFQNYQKINDQSRKCFNGKDYFMISDDYSKISYLIKLNTDLKRSISFDKLKSELNKIFQLICENKSKIYSLLKQKNYKKEEYFKSKEFNPLRYLPLYNLKFVVGDIIDKLDPNSVYNDRTYNFLDNLFDCFTVDTVTTERIMKEAEEAEI